MSDSRENLIRRIRARIGSVLEPDVANAIVESIIRELSNYEVTERCTDLAIPDGENEKIMKRFVACLRLDGKSSGTIYQYSRLIKMLDKMTGKPFTEIGVYDIRYFLAMEKERGISGRSLENERAVLSAFFQWMACEDLIQKNPCMNIKPIKFTEERRLPFSDTEMDALRGACRSKKERAIVEMLASTGLRVSELSQLDVSDIDMDTQTVKVRHGKGDKERITYMTAVAMKHYKDYLQTRKEMHPAAFTNRTGDRLNAGGIRKILKCIGDRAGVENVHPHRFRRTFATGLAGRGMDVQEVGKLLGHANINTTMIYVHTDDSAVRMSYSKYAV